jgi:predicted RND superfamily exporter protein
MHTYGSGLSVIFSYISERNIKSMLGASVAALLVISLILALVLRSFKLGLISLLPNLSPAFMAFGLWGYTVGQVGLAVSVMIAMTMGIVVDDTVHFLSKYRRARKEHRVSAEDAVIYAFKTVGSPILVTTLILVAGFTVLSFSGFQINANMGAMTAITLVFALIMDFFLLPALLVMLEGGAATVALLGPMKETQKKERP